MKVWIDQDLCTGDGLCEEIAPDVFVLWTTVSPTCGTATLSMRRQPAILKALRASRWSPPARRTSPSRPPRNAPESASSSNPEPNGSCDRWLL